MSDTCPHTSPSTSAPPAAESWSATSTRRSLRISEAHRFRNEPVDLIDGLHWNITGLYEEVLGGIERALQTVGSSAESIGIDSWAVDYGLIDTAGALLGLPYALSRRAHGGGRVRGPRRRLTDGPVRRHGSAVPTVQHDLPARCRTPTRIDRSRQPRSADPRPARLLAHRRRRGRGDQRLDHRTLRRARPSLEPRSRRSPRIRPPAVRRRGRNLAPSSGRSGRACSQPPPITFRSSASPLTTPPLPSSPSRPPRTTGRSSPRARGRWSASSWTCRSRQKPAALPTSATSSASTGRVRYLRNVMGLWLLQETMRCLEAQGKRWDLAELAAARRCAPSGRPGDRSRRRTPSSARRHARPDPPALRGDGPAATVRRRRPRPMHP